MSMIKIRTTAKRHLLLEDAFLGSLEYSDTTNGKSRIFDYICGSPKNKRIDIEYNDRKTKEEFSVKGFPSEELVEELTRFQKLILSTSLTCIYGTIRSASVISFSKTKLLRSIGSDREFEGEWPLSIAPQLHALLFK